MPTRTERRLDELLAERRKLPSLEAARLAVGLAEAYARGGLPGELRPADIAVDTVGGQLRLLAPGEELPARDAVQAVGGILYECLTGRPPRAGQEPELIPPRLLEPGVPALLDAACRRALERGYPDMASFLADLRAYEAAAVPTRRARRRSRTLVVAAGALVTLALLLPLGAVMWLYRAPGPTSGPDTAASDSVGPILPPPPPPPPPPAETAAWRELADRAMDEARRLAPAAAVLPLLDQALDEAVRADAPSEARQELLLFRAELLHRRGRWADAIAAADALAGTPAAREARLIRALALLRLDRDQEGLASLQALYQEDPSGVTGLTARAIHGVFAGAGERTLEWATTALRAGSEHHQARTTLGWALLNAGRPGEALPVLEEQRRRAPDDPRVLYALGSARVQLDDPRGALEAFDQALSLIDPHPFANLLMARIRVLLTLGDQQRLLPDLDRYLELRPDDPQTLVLRGGLRRGRGDGTGARADWEHARRLLTPQQFAQLVQNTLGPEMAEEVLRGR